MEATESVAATRTPLSQLLRRHTTIVTSIPWADKPLEFEMDIARPTSWGEISAIQQTQALAEIDGAESKADAIVGIVYALVMDARGVPGFEARHEGEHLTEFRARFRSYFDESDAAVLLITVFGKFAEEEMVPLSQRKATFRGTLPVL